MTDPIIETLELSVRHTKHALGKYSITININNTHISLSSHPYPHRAGNSTDIAIFDMTPEDVLKLGNLITAEAFQIKGLHEAEK